jgi:hypothetical protein
MLLPSCPYGNGSLPPALKDGRLVSTIAEAPSDFRY